MRKLTLRDSVIPMATLFASAAGAQPSEDEVPDIVVTATRRSEVSQSVPIAVSVLAGPDLAARGVTGINQLQYQTPGLEAVPAFGGGQPNFRLRGVGFDDYASNNSSPVGVYVDEIAKPFPIQTQGLLFDLDRVEVLRGPQGTLYGRNSTGGAINFITAKPTARTAAGIDVDAGSFGLFRGEGFLSGPLGGGWRARIAAATEQGGGFQRNRADGRGLGDADRLGARAQLAYRGGGLDLLIQGQGARDRSDGTGLYLFRPLLAPFGSPAATVAVPADRSRRLTGWGGSALFAGVSGIAQDTRPFRDNDTAGASARIGYDLGSGVGLTSLTGWERFRRREYNDWDASALADAGTLFASRVSTLSQEVRLEGGEAGSIRWLVGAYYARERLRDRFTSDFADSLGFVALTSYRQRAETVAGFGQIDWRLAPALTLTGGVRVEHERRTLANFTTTSVPSVGLAVTDAGSRIRYTEPSGKIGLAWTAAPVSLVYATASRGIKSGGFTAYNTLTTDQLQPFRPEVLYAYEVGTKNRLARGRLLLNVAGFYYDYRRQQVQSAIYDPVYGAVGRIVNASRSHIYGLEGELTWRPARGVEIVQGVAWRVGKFDRFQDLDIAASTTAGAARFVSRAGQDQGFPHWSYTGSASWRLPVGGYALTAATDYAYRGPNQPVLLGPAYRVRDYLLLNATLTVGPHDGPWTLGFYARNLLAQGYDLTRNFFLGGIDIASPGRPRSFGVRGRYTL